MTMMIFFHHIQSILVATTLIVSSFEGRDLLASAAGCYPGYSLGSSYSVGAWVSSTITTTTPITYTPCSPPGTASCPASGFKQEGGISTTETFNFQCISEYWCSQTGFAPSTIYWNQAWSKESTPCSGSAASLAPTKSPVFVSLPSVGGCPSNFIVNSPYEASDRISLNGIVYECMAWPQSLFCPQDAYKPDPMSKTNYWQQAWKMVGSCSGTIVPTTSPTTASGGGGCPPPWVAGGLSTYKENDRVSVVKSTTASPLVSTMVYKCKAWPLSGYCGQFSPAKFGGRLGWDLVGGCSGSIKPTTAPTFAAGSVAAGCPNMYNEAYTRYKSGDQVSKAIDGSSTHKMVYTCREWPNEGYCNQKGFAPGGEYSSMAWNQVGPCTGTLTPTSAPTEFTSACKYIRVVTTTPTPTPVVVDVAKWTSGVTYVAGDQVRVGGMTYQCKPWPYYFWCSNSAYQPTSSAIGLWTEAWTPSGPCQSVSLV